MPYEITVVFHNGPNHDYQFIMKVLANESKGQFECFRENTEKHKTFSVAIEKEIKKLIKMVMRILQLFLTK